MTTKICQFPAVGLAAAARLATLNARFSVLRVLAAAFARRVWLLVLGDGLAGLLPAAAQPIIVSNVPPYGATNVSPSAPVIFTFSAPMDADQTSVQFVDTGAFPPKS